MPTYEQQQPIVLPRKVESPSGLLDGGSSLAPKPPVSSGSVPAFDFTKIPAHSPSGPLTLASGSGGNGERPPWKDKPSHYLDVEETGALPYRDLSDIQMAPEGPLAPNPFLARREQEQAQRQKHATVMGELRGREFAPAAVPDAQRRQHAAMIGQLRGVAPDLRRLSVNRAFETQSRSDALKYAASQIDQGGHGDYASRRLGALGPNRLQRLRQLGPGFDSLLVDPGLMSRSHFDGFHQFASQRLAQSGGGGSTTLHDAFRLRDEYSRSLGNKTVYRGLKLKHDLAKNVQNGAVKLNPLVNRTLADHRKNDPKDRPGPGIIRQLVSGQRSSLPELNEAFDKPVSDVILHRVNKTARLAGREAGQPMSRENYLATQPPRPANSELSPEAYGNKLYAAYRNKEHARRKQHGKRIESESSSQSISYDPNVASGFASSELFGGGMPKDGEGIYNVHLNMSPLDVIAPEDYVPANQMSSGVRVNGKDMPNSSHLESLLLSPPQHSEISQVQHIPVNQLPQFGVLDEQPKDSEASAKQDSSAPSKSNAPKGKGAAPKPQAPDPKAAERAEKRAKQRAEMLARKEELRKKKDDQPPDSDASLL